MADSCKYLDILEITNDVNHSEKTFLGMTTNCAKVEPKAVVQDNLIINLKSYSQQMYELEINDSCQTINKSRNSEIIGGTMLDIHDALKEPELSLNHSNEVKDNNFGGMNHNYNLSPVSPDGGNFNRDFWSIGDLIEGDAKLKFGCFIKLVDCQVLLKSMIEASEIAPKNNKRKLKEYLNSKKSKAKKRKTSEQKKSLGQKSKAGKSRDRRTSSEFHVAVENTLSLTEDKNNPKVSKNATEESNIFTNMTSFLMSSATSKESPDAFDGQTNATDKTSNHQPDIKLRPSSDDPTQPECKESHDGQDSSSQSQSQKAEEPANNFEKVKKKMTLVYSSDDGSLYETPISKEEKYKHKKHKKEKSKKVKNKLKPGKSKPKCSPEKELRKSISSEYKKMKVDEALQKLQDAISIKPNIIPGPMSGMRIPKINQNSSGRASSTTSTEVERRKILTIKSESSEEIQNRLKDAGWTTSSRSDQKTGGVVSSVPGRNPNWDRSHRKRENFETLRQSPVNHERNTYREDRSPARSTNNPGHHDYRDNSRFKERYRGLETTPQFRRDSGRRESYQRPPLLPSPQNYGNISGDIQFLLKACNAIVDKDSNFSSEHRQHFSSACNRLREELERLIHSSALPQSPGSRQVQGSSAISLRDYNSDDVMSILRTFLPQDVFDKISKDISKLNLFGERFHPASPQSSTSSTSHLSPKHFHLPSKDFTGRQSFDVSRGDGTMPNKSQVMEERLVKKIENEIHILETLVKVQDQLLVDLEKTGQVSNPEKLIINDLPTTLKSDPSDQVKSLNKSTIRAATSFKSPSLNESFDHISSSPEKSQELLSSNKCNEQTQSSDDKDKVKKTEEEIINLCRNALKSYYQKGSVTTEEFKVIMKKAIAKISESKCKDITQPKVSRFIDSLVSNVTSKRKKNKT